MVECGHAHRDQLATLHRAAKDYMVLHGSAVRLDLAAYPLPLNFNRAGYREPDIADDAAAVPPVVPGIPRNMLTHGQPGDRLLRGAIVDLDSEVVCRLKMMTDIQRVGGKAALVTPNFYTIHPYARRIECGSKVQLDVIVG